MDGFENFPFHPVQIPSLLIGLIDLYLLPFGQLLVADKGTAHFRPYDLIEIGQVHGCPRRHTLPGSPGDPWGIRWGIELAAGEFIDIRFNCIDIGLVDRGCHELVHRKHAKKRPYAQRSIREHEQIHPTLVARISH